MYFVSIVYSSTQIKYAAKEFADITDHSKHVIHFIYTTRAPKYTRTNAKLKSAVLNTAYA
jgi:hypothetical protein